MQNLFLYIAVGFIGFTAFSSSLDKSTQIHCANGIQAACMELSK